MVLKKLGLPAHSGRDVALSCVAHHPWSFHGPHHAGIYRDRPLDACGAVEVMRNSGHPRVLLLHAMSLLHGQHLLPVQLLRPAEHATTAAAPNHHAGRSGSALAGGCQLGAGGQSLLDLTDLRKISMSKLLEFEFLEY